MSDYETALRLLENASRSGSRLGLERITKLIELLGEPQKSYKIIHVAGTNGKGSFSAMMSSVLTAQGYKTGVFSSPYMLTYNDCVRVNGELVSAQLFGDAVIRAWRAAETMEDKPTEFELLTAAVFMLLKEQGCEYALIECGMGGDGDSTNVIDRPLLSVITNVELDHCAFLGNTHSEIASHKAGIIKQGRPVYFGGDNAAALKVISDVARCNGSSLYRPEPSCVEYASQGDLSTNSIRLRYKGADISVPLGGTYQYKNILNVVSCIEILRDIGVTISDTAVCRGLENVRWEGRFEALHSDPKVIFDGAHNPDGMRELCRSIKQFFPDVKPVILIGVLADKDFELYGEMLSPLICRAYAVAPDNPRALDPIRLSKALQSHGITSEAFETIEKGFEAAYSFCLENKLPLLVIGSLYMYKDIRRITDKIAH